MRELADKAPRFLFFTGKGGVGKTSTSSALAVGLADAGRRVLLISTDPASNLDQVLETPLGSTPTPVAPGLDAMNINPIQAAAAYRERMVGPYRGVLPDETIRQMEEQLSGACTVEVAGFNEFSRFIGDEAAIAAYDHVILDTAPTGHTLRLLSLPSAWNEFIENNRTGSSCLGPVSGLKEQKKMCEIVVAALKDPAKTLLVLVSRPELMSLGEAARAGGELRALGLNNQHLIVNGVFGNPGADPTAQAFARVTNRALADVPAALAPLPRSTVPFRAEGALGLGSLRSLFAGESDGDVAPVRFDIDFDGVDDWDALLDDLAAPGRGVIMTMGKGGVGKTSMAAMIACELARRGRDVLLSTTDPAAHVAEAIGADLPRLEVDRIDPKAATEDYVEGVLAKNRDALSPADLELLEEELRSPCIEEIAVFHAFAKTVASGLDRFVVLDTAPTGHTLLLLDATEAYHREVAKSTSELPPEVHQLLPRVRDPEFTRILIVSLPEATPVSEAAVLQDDLARADIRPYGWIVNRCFALTGTEDARLTVRAANELGYIQQVAKTLSPRTVLSPWVDSDLVGRANLSSLMYSVREKQETQT